jgi:hypothetical protein
VARLSWNLDISSSYAFMTYILAVVNKLSNGLGELGFLLLLCLPRCQLRDNFVFKPFETGRQPPNIIRIHPYRIFLMGHEKHILLFT